MKKYKFRLERALSVRQLQASRERGRFEQAIGEMRRIENERERLIAASAEATASARTQPMTGLELVSLDNFLDHNARLDRALVRRLAEAAARVTAMRAQLVAAERKVKVLEKLEQRARKKWKSEFDRELEALSGETYLARWKRPARAS